MDSQACTHLILKVKFMKNKFLGILILCSMVSCESYLEELEQYKNPESVELYYLDAFESESASDSLIANRKVLKTFNLEGNDQRLFVKSFLKAENYEPISRKCPFEPVYALKIDGKIIAFLDVEFCPGVEHQLPDGSKKFYQLKKDSPIRVEVEKLQENNNELNN